jgi:hypothetical protein
MPTKDDYKRAWGFAPEDYKVSALQDLGYSQSDAEKFAKTKWEELPDNVKESWEDWLDSIPYAFE